MKNKTISTFSIFSIFAVSCMPSEGNIIGSYSPKIDKIIAKILDLKHEDPDSKIIIFSQWDTILNAIKPGLLSNNIDFRYSANTSKFAKEINEFKDVNGHVTCLLLNLKFGNKGLNLVEAQHIFLVEPILNPDDEMQGKSLFLYNMNDVFLHLISEIVILAVGRVHRIGQTKITFVHRFITKKTIEENIFNKIITEKDKWSRREFTIKDLQELLKIEFDEVDNEISCN